METTKKKNMKKKMVGKLNKTHKEPGRWRLLEQGILMAHDKQFAWLEAPTFWSWQGGKKGLPFSS